jgi:hypothetical protein
VAVLPLSAQWRHFGDRQARPTGYFGLGFSTPANPVATRLNEGWNLAGGVGVTKAYIGVMVDAMFSDFGINDTALARAGARRGRQRYWAVTVDPIFHVNERGPVDFYLTGGGGLYGRMTSYRTSSDLIGQSSVRYDLISSDTIHKPGVNGGAGFSFRFDDRSNIRIFVEARYHHMFTRGPGASFIPVTVGLRF